MLLFWREGCKIFGWLIFKNDFKELTDRLWVKLSLKCQKTSWMHIIASVLPCFVLMAVCEGYSCEVSFVPFTYYLCVFCLIIQADEENNALLRHCRVTSCHDQWIRWLCLRCQNSLEKCLKKRPENNLAWSKSWIRPVCVWWVNIR